MAGPWEKFAATAPAPAARPWEKFAAAPAGGDPSMAGVPGYDMNGMPQVARAPEVNDDGILQRIAGAGEAALALGTGAVGGLAGAAAGLGKAALRKITTGQGSSDAEVDKTVSDVADALTYRPKTKTGANLTQLVGDAVTGSGVAGLALPELNAVASATGNAVRAVRNTGAPAAAIQRAANLRDLAAPVVAPVVRGAGAVVKYPANVAKAVVQPFTRAGQDAISGQIIQKFAEDGPTALNAAELVPGSAPTLAEATGNAGIARLQSVTRDLAPNRFVAREKANSNARSIALGEIAGDQSKLDFFKQDRATVAENLYNEAAKADASAAMTPKVQKQIDMLLKRPSIQEATAKARKFAAERDEAPSDAGSLRGLHDTKTALDDMISKAVRDGEGGHAEALQATKESLLDVIETLSPAYKEARETYAAMSQPVNQMDTLQGLNLKDAKGNITLQKVQSAIDIVNKRRNKDGIDAAKSLTNDQLNTLGTIRDDLLRQSNLGLGKSAGSNTLQNIATDNIISTILPGRLGELAKDKLGGTLGQVGRLAYSGPNEAIKARLIDKMLDPKLAEKDLKNLNQLTGGNR